MVSRWGVLGLAAGSMAVGAGGVAAFTHARADSPVTYVTSTVGYDDIESTVMASGTLEPANIVDVAAQTTGQIQALTVKVGDPVTKGEKIGQIDPILLNNAVKSAQNLLTTYGTAKASMTAQLGVTQADANRQHILIQQGVGTQSAVERADAQLKSSQASVASMEAQAANAQLSLEAAQANLEKANIRSPIDGLVAEVLINEGASVNTNNQAPVVLRVAKMDMMAVRAQISEADVMKIDNGASVYFTVLGEPDTRYDAKLRSLGYTPSTGQLDPSKGAAIKQAIYYNALLDLPNRDGRLRPGMTANVHIVLGQAKHVLVVPLAALGAKIDKTHYKVAVLNEKGRAIDRDVVTGLANAQSIEVKSGLKPGDKVVIGQTVQSTAGGGPAIVLPASWKG